MVVILVAILLILCVYDWAIRIKHINAMKRSIKDHEELHAQYKALYKESQERNARILRMLDKSGN